MQFNEIFEKTKYAFEHDEVFELLMGEKGYAYQAPMVPVSIPTHDEHIFGRGVFPYYNSANTQKKSEIRTQIVNAIKRMIYSDIDLSVLLLIRFSFPLIFRCLKAHIHKELHHVVGRVGKKHRYPMEFIHMICRVDSVSRTE